MAKRSHLKLIVNNKHVEKSSTVVERNFTLIEGGKTSKEPKSLFLNQTKKKRQAEIREIEEDLHREFLDCDLFYTGHLDYEIESKFALFPVKTKDMGFVWFRNYIRFRIREGRSWKVVGMTVTRSSMWKIKKSFISKLKGIA